MKRPHDITTSISPITRNASCSCGWSVQVRRQGWNARAAVAHLNGLIKKHEDAVAALDNPKTTD